MINKKGQVSIELIILVGMLIIGAIVLSVTLISSYNKNIDTTDDTVKRQTDLVDNFVDDLDDLESQSPSQSGANNFTISFLLPSSGVYSSENLVPFRITYSGQTGAVTCNWSVSIQPVGPIPTTFNGCDTSRSFGVGTYNVSYSVTDGTSTLTGNSSFRVQ